MNSCGLRRSTHHPSGEVERKPTAEHEVATQRLLTLRSTRSLNHLSPLENFSLCTGSISEQINPQSSLQDCFILAEKTYTLQSLGQKNLNPAIASIAMCLESVFGTLSGWIVLGQRLSFREAIGCILMFGAIVLSQFLGNDEGTQSDDEVYG